MRTTRAGSAQKDPYCEEAFAMLASSRNDFLFQLAFNRKLKVKEKREQLYRGSEFPSSRETGNFNEHIRYQVREGGQSRGIGKWKLRRSAANSCSVPCATQRAKGTRVCRKGRLRFLRYRRLYQGNVIS